MSFYNPKKWQYINVRGLGLIKGIHCPHYNSKTLKLPRKKHFQNIIKKVGGQGIAVENNCAIEFIDGKYFRILSAKPGAGAYKVYKKHGKVISDRIENKAKLAPIAELYR